MMFKDIDEELSIIKAKFEGKFVYVKDGPLMFQDNRIFLFQKITFFKAKECTIEFVDVDCNRRHMDADIDAERWDKCFNVISGD